MRILRGVECSDQLIPKAVEALKDSRIVLISGGWRHTAAADDTGKLYAWGWNKVQKCHSPIVYRTSKYPPFLRCILSIFLSCM